VNGNLALSRAIGDFEFKKSPELPPEQQIVTAFPDVNIHEITEDDEFLVVACDGIWDCMSSQAVIEFVRRGVAAGQELHQICENLMDNCLASNSDTGGVGCDNMTVVIISLLHGQDKDTWYKTVASRVANGDGPCAPPEYAEFRGPGVHHRYDDSPEDLDMDMMDHKGSRSFGGNGGGRIIVLGDGTELTSSEADTDMFDHEDEDHDLDQQVKKETSAGAEKDELDASELRRQREGTPAPTGAPVLGDKISAEPVATTASPSSVSTEKSEEEIKKE